MFHVKHRGVAMNDTARTLMNMSAKRYPEQFEPASPVLEDSITGRVQRCLTLAEQLETELTSHLSRLNPMTELAPPGKGIVEADHLVNALARMEQKLDSCRGLLARAIEAL
jgi:hypothetical protein